MVVDEGEGEGEGKHEADVEAETSWWSSWLRNDDVRAFSKRCDSRSESGSWGCMRDVRLLKACCTDDAFMLVMRIVLEYLVYRTRVESGQLP